MRLQLQIFAFLLISVLFLSGCNYCEIDKINSPSGQNITDFLEPQNGEINRQILAGQNIPIGKLTVWNDNDNVYFRYSTRYKFEFSAVHLAAYPVSNQIPVNPSGCPQIGHFPYKQENLPVNTHIYTFSIPCSILAVGSSVYIAAHADAVLRNDNGSTSYETAWAEGQNFPGCSNWSMYFVYNVKNLKPE